MILRRALLVLILAVVVPGQALAGYAQQLPCRDGADGGPAAVTMDCHEHRATGTSGDTAPCCGDQCPDMTACAGHATQIAAAPARIAPGADVVPSARRSPPPTAAHSFPPFRPPARLHA